MLNPVLIWLLQLPEKLQPQPLQSVFVSEQTPHVFLSILPICLLQFGAALNCLDLQFLLTCQSWIGFDLSRNLSCQVRPG
jgi:hypothetical protein